MKYILNALDTRRMNHSLTVSLLYWLHTHYIPCLSRPPLCMQQSSHNPRCTGSDILTRTAQTQLCQGSGPVLPRLEQLEHL